MRDIIAYISRYLNKQRVIGTVAVRKLHRDRRIRSLPRSLEIKRQYAAHMDRIADSSAPRTQTIFRFKAVPLRLGVLGQVTDRPVVTSDDQARVVPSAKEALTN